MKGVILVVSAVAALALAARIGHLDAFCPVNATGTATYAGETYPCTMMRVGKLARIDLLKDNAVFASIVSRGDLNIPRIFYWFPSTDDQCESIPYFLYLPQYSFYLAFPNGTEVHKLWYNDEVIAYVTLNGEDLIGETLVLPGGMTVDIVYDEVNKDFVNEDGDIFKLPECGEEASTSADANTRRLCSDSKPLPDSLCSVSANGTAQVTSDNAGSPLTMYFKMIRVKNTARYDLYTDAQQSSLYASIFIRSYTFGVFLYDAIEEQCKNSFKVFFPFSGYRYTVTADGYDIYETADNNSRIFFYSGTYRISKEELSLFDSGPVKSVVMNYDNVDLTYEHNTLDDAFSLDTDIASCSDLKSQPILALTSYQCSELKVKKPSLPGCALDVDIIIDGEPANCSIYNADDGYFKRFYRGKTTIVRCDYKNNLGECFGVMADDVDCFIEFEYSKSNFYGLIGFEYRGEPWNATCPDGSESCKQYCTFDDRDNLCYILDEDERLVYASSLDVSFTYKDTVPSLSDFAVALCDGETLDAPTKDVCNPRSSSSSKSSKDDSSEVSSLVSISQDVYIVVDFDDDMDLASINVSELLEAISTLCDIDQNEMTIVLEKDEEGNVIRVILYVKEESTARTIADKLNDLDQGGSTGILSRVTGATLNINGKSLSRGIRASGKTLISLLMLAYLIVMMLIP